MKKKIFSLLLVLAMVFSLTACGSKEKATTAPETTEAPPTPREQSDAAWAKSGGTVNKTIEADTAASVNISLDGSKLGALIMGAELPITANLTIAADQAKEIARLALDVSMEGTPLADLVLGLEKKSFVLGSEALLGGQYYGTDLTKFKENFDASIFSPTSGSEFAIPQEIYDELVSMFEQLPAQLNAQDANAQKVADAMQEAFDELEKTMDKNMAVAETDEKITVNGAEVDTHVLTWTADTAALKAMEADFKAWAKDSAKLKEAIELLQNSMGAAAATGEVPEINLNEELQKWVAAETSFKEGDKLVIAENINKANGEIARVTVVMNSGEEGEEVTLTADFAPDWETMSYVDVKMTDKKGEETQTMDFLVKSEKTDEKLAFEAVITVPDEEPMTLSLNWTAADGAFTLKLADEVELSGTCKTEGNVTTIIPEKLTAGSGEDAESLEDFGVVITLTENPELAELPAYKEILSMTADEINALMETVSEMASAFLM